MSFLLGKFGMYLILVAICLIALAVVARNWSCRPQPEPKRDRLGPYTVLGVQTGASLEVGQGRHDRRIEVILLEGIAAPILNQPCAVESREALRAAAGEAVTIETEGGRRDERQLAVYGESGQCLQESQIRAGLAWIDSVWAEIYDVPDGWLAAQKEAKKAKRGIWAKP